ncbi:MAG TPA: hypothetical protein VL691_15585 [Vicinamibacteria bacterium]|nr:hypothetical protein [Vicinamibacteria bacterium]
MKSRVAVIALLAASRPVAGGAGEKMKAEEVIAHHLEALGTAEARAAARDVEGSCAMTPIASVGVAGALLGRFRFDSEASRFALRMKFPSQGYPEESFAFEGGKPEVGFVLPGKRSALGNFVSTNEVILREGLLGGVLNGSWALLALAERGAKVSYDGLKKREGRELHRLSYRAKKGQGDLDIALFFDPDTFRHVASVYKASHAQSLGTTMESSSSQPDVYLQIEETFSDFKPAKGLTLPTSWTIRYETQAQVTQHWKYELKAEKLEK